MDRNEASTVICTTGAHPGCPDASSPACRQVVATLAYDSRVHAVATEVRSIKTGFPRLLYRAPGVEIDLQVRLSPTAGRYCLLGQVVDNDFDPCTGWVLVEAARGIVQTGLDEHGSFSIDNLPAGEYQMEVSLPEAHIEIPAIRF